MDRTFPLLVIYVFLFTSCGPKIEPSPSAAWTQLASMPTARSENAAALLGNVVYVQGGLAVSGSLKRMIVPAVSIDGVVYVLGGADRAGAISNQGLAFALKP